MQSPTLSTLPIPYLAFTVAQHLYPSLAPLVGVESVLAHLLSRHRQSVIPQLIFL